MKQIIEDIRYLSKDGSFKDEQHVRFSFAGRLCQESGSPLPVIHTNRAMYLCPALEAELAI